MKNPRLMTLKLRMGLFVAEFARIPTSGQREFLGILANSATAIRNARLQRLMKGCLAGIPLLCGLAIVDRATAVDGSASPKVADRAACSSLIQCKQPTEKALQTIAGLGYRWVDLSCLSWAGHVSVMNVRGFP